ncbi:hypothetical protein F4819DRAFT_396035 [Hypoxylon fuscum]|nr:hypothetical protein F4819DRAFT_396035 [Hypoxylon fuscum]
MYNTYRVSLDSIVMARIIYIIRIGLSSQRAFTSFQVFIITILQFKDFKFVVIILHFMHLPRLPTLSRVLAIWGSLSFVLTYLLLL